jgi:hypothetical protein
LRRLNSTNTQNQKEDAVKKTRTSDQPAGQAPRKTTIRSFHLLVAPLLILAVALAVLVGRATPQQERYTLRVPNGLAFSEFKGYQDWQVVGPSHTDAQNVMRIILANPVMMKAYRSGIPTNGKPFPDGSRIAKIEWKPKKITDAPYSANAPDTVPGDLTAVEFIEKDTKRFADSNGWGYAEFKFDAASNTFAPEGTGAKCGTACHQLAAANDYIFTAYPKR